MADSPYEQIRAIREALTDHIHYLWMDSPIPPDQTETVVRRLLAPLGRPAAPLYADRMYAATVAYGDLDPEIESAVGALMAVMGHAFAREVRHLTDASLRRLGMAPETPAGDSLTTAREGVTGTPGAGSNEVPVTPAGVTYVREAGWHVWSCGSCGEGGSGLAKSVAEAAYAAHSCTVTPAGGASWLD